ncbi:MAG TPA: hypothetical protein VIT19_05950 [Pyrinomonadaceae bacterium]
MQEHAQKRIELIANLAIIITAVLLCAVLTKSLISKPETASRETVSRDDVPSPVNRRPNPQIEPGTKLQIDGIDWAGNGQTLVIALSDKCRFCTESASFYQRLMKGRGKTRVVAVFPQSDAEGKSYLEKLSVTVDEIKHTSFPAIGIRATPTLILMDANGSALKSWVGKLAADRETEVLDSLQ